MKNYAEARNILGLDFVTPEEIMKAKAVNYSNSQIEKLRETIPQEDVLLYLKSHEYILVPGPPEELSLWDLFRAEPGIFSLSEHKYWQGVYEKELAHPRWDFGRYKEYEKGYGELEKLGCKWLAIRKKIIQGTREKTFKQQLVFLDDNERVATAIEAIWGMKVHKYVRGIELPEDKVSFIASSVDRRGFYVVASWICGKISIAFFENKVGCWMGLSVVFNLD